MCVCMNMLRKLTEKDMAAIEEILKNKPEPWNGFAGNKALRPIDTI